jgi:hypothetical protein
MSLISMMEVNVSSRSPEVRVFLGFLAFGRVGGASSEVVGETTMMLSTEIEPWSE